MPDDNDQRKHLMRSDLDKLLEEKNAAAHLRDAVCWAIGFLVPDSINTQQRIAVRKKLEEALERHTDERCSDIF